MVLAVTTRRTPQALAAQTMLRNASSARPDASIASSFVTGHAKVHDPRDRVLITDREQSVDVGDIGLHDVDGEVGQVRRHIRSPALEQHALLTCFDQGTDSVRADEAGPSSNENHARTFIKTDRQYY